MEALDAIETAIIFRERGFGEGNKLHEDDAITFIQENGIGSVTRYNIRNIFADLMRRGILTTGKSRSVEIKYYSKDELEDIYVVRRLLEEKAIDIMPLPLDSSQLENLKKCYENHKGSVERYLLSIQGVGLEYGGKKDFEAGLMISRYNHLFHSTFFSFCNNVYLSEQIDHFADMIFSIRNYMIRQFDMLSTIKRQQGDSNIEIKDVGSVYQHNELMILASVDSNDIASKYDSFVTDIPPYFINKYSEYSDDFLSTYINGFVAKLNDTPEKREKLLDKKRRALIKLINWYHVYRTVTNFIQSERK